MLLPTTRAQVSGHKFLSRRIHHGLVFGDIRMIHDPLAARARAGLFGLVATVLVAAGAGLFALLDARPHPGEAPILRAESGALYVRVANTLHPVSNLASARLIIGEPADPVAIDQELLAASQQGHPVGLPDAPGVIASAPPQPEYRIFSACLAPTGALVNAGSAPRPLGSERGVLLIDATGSEHLLSAAGVAALPAADTPLGRILRRRLGIHSQTPRWEASAELLAAFPTQAPLRAPDPLPEVIHTDAGWWLEHGTAVAELTALQAEILLDLGATRREAPRPEIAGRDSIAADLALPEQILDFLTPQSGEWPCSAGRGETIGILTPGPGAVLDGGFATEFIAPQLADGAISVDTGHGFQLVTQHGVRHEVASPAALAALGAPEPIPVAWEVLRLLPAGSTLRAGAPHTTEE